MENRNLGGSLDLLALNGAVLIESTKTAGELILCIPVTKANLQAYKRESGKQSCYLNIFGLARDDERGNNFMVTRSLSKAESDNNEKIENPEERKRGEILGNAKFLTPKVTNAAPTATASDVIGDQAGNDLPF